MTLRLKQTCPLFIASLVLISCNSNKNTTAFKLKQGDLLFQNTGTSNVANAIKDVTATSLSKNYSHVGIAMQKDDQWFVVEAIQKSGGFLKPL